MNSEVDPKRINQTKTISDMGDQTSYGKNTNLG